MTKASESTESK